MISKLILSIKTSIFSNQFFGGAFWLGIMTAIFFQLKNVPFKLFNLIKKYVVYTIYFDENDELYYYFEKWLDKYYKQKYRIVEASITFKRNTTEYEKTDKDKKEKQIYKKQYLDTFIIWYKKRPLYIFKGREKLEQAQNIRNAFYNHYKIIGFKAKELIDDMLEEVLKFNTVENKKKSVYFNRFGEWSLFGEKIMRNETTIFLNKNTKNKVFNNINNFVKNKKFYNDKGIPHKYGILLHGSPGNGKTTLIQVISEKYDKDIYYLDLHDEELSDKTLKFLFKGLKPNSLLIIEDVDSFFENKRKLKNKKLSFSGFLNCLDGILSADDFISIFTTNKKINLDEALMRPGRIDLIVEIPKPTINEVKDFYEHFFNEDLDINNLKNGHNMAEIQDIFLTNIGNPEKVKELI